MAVAAARLFTLVSRAAPAGKTRSSPDTGAAPPAQFAFVPQLLSEPAPLQVFVAAALSDGVAMSAAHSRHAPRNVAYPADAVTVTVMFCCVVTAVEVGALKRNHTDRLLDAATETPV